MTFLPHNLAMQTFILYHTPVLFIPVMTLGKPSISTWPTMLCILNHTGPSSVVNNIINDCGVCKPFFILCYAHGLRDKDKYPKMF